MAAASHVSLVLDHQRIEFLPGAREGSRQGHLPGGLKRNIEFVSECVEFANPVPEDVRNLLYDPQTSGGLLLAVEPADRGKLLDSLRRRLVPAGEIGEAAEKTRPLIRVL